VRYDEFGLLHENAEEHGLPEPVDPRVRRTAAILEDGRQISAIVWGDEPAELVLIHGGGQNAHTWDTVALALGRPLVAIDLPGHGHSDAGPDGPFSYRRHCDDVAAAIEQLAPDARLVVGMSLGGLVTLAVAAAHPALVRGLVLVDVTPSISPQSAAPIQQFIAGPETFADFDEILRRTIEFNPTRSVSSLRRGVLHNARELPDGRWAWRHRRSADLPPQLRAFDPSDLWEDVARITVPITLVRGLAPGAVVDDAAVDKLRQLAPGARVESVEGAGHSIQGDKPLELAAILADVLGSVQG
jgi:pimeloyl-ACP methyl ester carboxylesterase